VVEPFKVHVADEVLDDLRARLRRTRWPDEVPGIGWKQGTNLDWLQRLVSYWTNEFDWRAWEQRLGALDHFTWEGIHFVHKRAPSGRECRLSSRTAGPVVSSITWTCCRC
jgi:microsomal epoxide hydrolase